MSFENLHSMQQLIGRITKVWIERRHKHVSCGQSTMQHDRQRVIVRLLSDKAT